MIINDKLIKLIGNEREILQVSYEVASRSIGVYIMLSLGWSTQFQGIKRKMHKAIAKLNSIEIKPYLMCSCFNTCLIKSMFLGVEQ